MIDLSGLLQVIGVVGILVGASTTYMRLYVSSELKQVRQDIIEAIDNKYVRKDMLDVLIREDKHSS